MDQPAWVSELFGEFVRGVQAATEVVAVLVHGSLPLDDFQDGRSDLDLVVVVPGPLPPADESAVVGLHRRLVARDRRAAALHCAYVDATTITEIGRPHPVWAQEEWKVRPLSAYARIELGAVGRSLLGPEPADVVPRVTDAAAARQVHEDATGYWLPHTRTRRLWLLDVWVDIGLTSAVRAGVTLSDRGVIGKTEAIERLRGLGVPGWLVEDLSARRAGRPTDRSVGHRLRRARLASAEVARLFGDLTEPAARLAGLSSSGPSGSEEPAP